MIANAKENRRCPRPRVAATTAAVMALMIMGAFALCTASPASSFLVFLPVPFHPCRSEAPVHLPPESGHPMNGSGAPWLSPPRFRCSHTNNTSQLTRSTLRGGEEARVFYAFLVEDKGEEELHYLFWGQVSRRHLLASFRMVLG